MLPLVTLPYLARVLGVASFGNLAIASAVVGYATVLAEWGFALSGTQAAARCRDTPTQLRDVFWSITGARLGLGVVASCIVVGICALYTPLKAQFVVAIVLSSQVLAGSLTPVWFLQGTERMGAFTIASLLGRLTVVPLTFMFIHRPSDLLLVLLINSFAGAVTAVCAMYLALRNFELLPINFSIRSSLKQISDGFDLFISQAAVALFSQTNVLIIGAIAGPIQAGLFSGADKVRRAAQTAYSPISIVLFPRINILSQSDAASARRLVFIALSCQVGIAAIVGGALFLLAPLIVALVLGDHFAAAVDSLRVLSLAPPAVAASNVLGTNVLVPNNRKRLFSIILTTSGLMNVFLLSLLVPLRGAVGGAIALSATEYCVLVALLICVLRYRLLSTSNGPAMEPGDTGDTRPCG